MSMKTTSSFRFTTGVLGYPLFFVLLIWLVFWADFRFGFHFNELGIYPRKLKGLIGIIFSPFVHGSLAHVYHNSIPLLVLSMALFYFYRPVAWKIVVGGILLSGFMTWCIGSSAYHIGASGLIYVLLSFLLFKGLLSKHYRLIALSLVVVFLYGGMIWYIFPVKEKMSWEGHFSGFVVGILFSLRFKSSIAKPIKYAWEQPDFDASDDPFLQQFDEDGNFIEPPKQEQDSKISIHYTFKEEE